jgi:hypothetical protein
LRQKPSSGDGKKPPPATLKKNRPETSGKSRGGIGGFFKNPLRRQTKQPEAISLPASSDASQSQSREPESESMQWEPSSSPSIRSERPKSVKSVRFAEDGSPTSYRSQDTVRFRGRSPPPPGAPQRSLFDAPMGTDFSTWNRRESSLRSRSSNLNNPLPPLPSDQASETGSQRSGLLVVPDSDLRRENAQLREQIDQQAAMFSQQIAELTRRLARAEEGLEKKDEGTRKSKGRGDGKE